MITGAPLKIPFACKSEGGSGVCLYRRAVSLEKGSPFKPFGRSGAPCVGYIGQLFGYQHEGVRVQGNDTAHTEGARSGGKSTEGCGTSSTHRALVLQDIPAAGLPNLRWNSA